MEKLTDKFGILVAFGGTLGTFLFGEWEIGLQILITLMVCDFISGIICGYKEKDLSSRKGYDGLKKKFSILLILILAVSLDRLIGQGWVFRTLVIYFYVAMEGLSMLENASRLGVPIPDGLKDALIQLKDSNRNEGVNSAKQDFK